MSCWFCSSGLGAAIAHKALKLTVFFFVAVDTQQLPVAAIAGIIVVVVIDMVDG